MAAYECVLTGKRLHHRSTREDSVRALEMMNRAIEIDPQYAHAHAWKACTFAQSIALGAAEDPAATLKVIRDELSAAQALDDNDSDVHRILAAMQVLQGDFDQAEYHQKRALELNPNDDLIVVQQGENLTWMGQAEGGIEWILKAMRLNPYHPKWFWGHLGRAYFVARRYDEAIEALRHINQPDISINAFLAAAYARLGDDKRVERHRTAIQDRVPKFSVEVHLSTMHYMHEADREHHWQSLILAGLPA